jgi:MFS family permease
MNAASALVAAPRAGRLLCLCAPPGERMPVQASRVALHAGSFAASVVAQVLTFAVLPLAGILYAPASTVGALPYAAFFVGAAVATFPASFLLDAFGRRAAFALGASMGVAGGLMLAWALTHAFFPGLVLGGLWLGVANGFSLFHRHAAAPSHPQAIGIVLAAGAAAGVLAPTLAAASETFAPATSFVGVAAAAAAAHVLSLVFAVALPPSATAEAVPITPATPSLRAFAVATGIGAFAWFVMAALMGAHGLRLFACGFPVSAVGSGISWHVVAMYAPALLLVVSVRSVRVALALGPALLAAAGVMFVAGVSVSTLSLVVLGAGWSMSTAGASVVLCAEGPPPRCLLAAHDFVLLVAAVSGALASVAASAS